MRIPFFGRRKPTQTPAVPDSPLSLLDEVLTPTSNGEHMALRGADDIAAVLHEQTERAYSEAIHERASAARLNQTELHLQPGVINARGDVLADVLYLEAVLHGARDRRLDPALIVRLETAVDTGHDLVVTLAECAIATATATTPGAS
ncbi:hypothetical protein [Streptomyces sp. NPDC006552]|uniref:hypothetical protein n=1 Tax=Streptomyces sp. NPDC006552 TaxID=3157179 RepID=UPI0033BCA357